MENKLTLVEAAGYVADTQNPNSMVNDWYLSTNRAASVINYLYDNYQIKYDLLVAIGHGINDPIADNSTEEGRKKKPACGSDHCGYRRGCIDFRSRRQFL